MSTTTTPGVTPGVTTPGDTPTGVTVLLTQLSRVVYRRTSEDLLGMRLKEFVMLALVRDHSPIPQQELGEVLCIDANNLVLLLNQLESRGFAYRRRDPTDRRRHLVEITEEGRAACERAEHGIESVEEDVLASLSGPERSELHALLVKALDGSPAPG
jgi:DNA-binding MarR family transcriptional regulator